MMRRRRVTSAAAESNLEDTNTDDDAQAALPTTLPVVSDPVEPSRKDRFPMPWGLVVTDVFSMDVHKTFKRLTDELALGDGATEYGTVLHALDKSARNLFDAVCLMRKAQTADEDFQAELGQRLEVLRSAAIASLEEDRAAKKRSKAPTLEDIKDRMLASWPDEMRSINARKSEMHGAFRSIEGLVTAWQKRCDALRVMCDRRGGGV